MPDYSNNPIAKSIRLIGNDIDDKPDTLVELADTPAVYANGEYLMSTSSGVVWIDEIDGGTFI